MQQTYSTGVGPSFSSLFKKSSIKKDGKAADVAILSINPMLYSGNKNLFPQ